MLETLRYLPFRAKEVWFARMPYEVSGCELVEFRDCKQRFNTSMFKRSEAQTLVIDLTQDLDAIWAKFDKKSCRYEIKRAERDGIQAWKSDLPEVFWYLNRVFRKRKRLGRSASQSYMFKYCTVFLARDTSGIVAGQAYLEDKDTIRWLYGASIEETHANRLLTWTAIQYAKNKRIKEFDFGGYDAVKHPSISFFKQSFGGTLTTRYNYSKWCLPSVITDMAKRINERLHGLDFSISDGVAGHHSSPSGDRYLEDCLRGIGIKETDSILDVGCGKGSAMLTMLKFPFAEVDGLDSVGQLSDIALANVVKGYIQAARAFVYTCDARKFQQYDQYNMVYFYNPFPADVMTDVMELIESSLIRNERRMTIIYNNPTCHEQVVHDGFFRKVAEYPNRWGTGIYVYSN